MTRTSCAWARVGLGRKLYFCRCSRGSPLVAASSHTTRRFLSSKPPGAPKEPEIAATIPGPSWLWLDPIVEPFRAYGRVQRRRPYTTQFVSSLVIYFVGDLVAQSIADPVSSSGTGEEAGQEQKGWVQEWSNNRDWHRTGRSILIGGISSIPAYKWFLFLGNNFNYASKIWSLTVKVTVNQAVFTPVFNSFFFGTHSFLTGATIPEVVERIKNTVPTSWVNSCKVWPIFTAFSFTYVPIHYRSIFGGVVAIGWQTYLSLLNQRAAAKELAELEADQTHDQSALAQGSHQKRSGEKQKWTA